MGDGRVTVVGSAGHWPVPFGDSPNGTGGTRCQNPGPSFFQEPRSFRPASGWAAQAGRLCYPYGYEISGLELK